jgi:5'-methylthioadenosine phosphorylase
MEQGNIALVGGTGFEQLPPELFAEHLDVDTAFGLVRVQSVSNNYVEPFKLFFLSRHGASHSLAPHQIDYLANIEALRKLDVRHVLATNAVGSLRADIQPGELVLFDDFIDLTRQRNLTFHRDGEWKHTDFTTPYDEQLRSAVLTAANKLGVPIHTRSTYLCVDGPRFETPAEIRMFASWGADVVGMTGIPEAVFAKEAGIGYAALGIVTNLAAGLRKIPVSHDEVVSIMQENLPIVRELLLSACATIRLLQDFETL